MGKLFKEITNCWKITHTENIRFLIDGEKYFLDLFQTLQEAKHHIFIIGWDINSEIYLVRNNQDHPSPSQLGPFLNYLVDKNEALEIYILNWDFHTLYSFEREKFPNFKWNFQSHDRIYFHLDDEHPITGSHHQKIVVVDDRIAYCGGLDITHNRWDNSKHQSVNSNRKNPWGQIYSPFHDVQIKVEGETARALGELARWRWEKAKTSSPSLPKIDLPKGLRSNQGQYEIAISRTLPKYRDREEVREVEQMTLDLISAAQKLLYIENQYLSSYAVSKALVESLKKKEGPEIILISSFKADGWVEETILDSLKRIWISRLFEADQYNRLGLFYPMIQGNQNIPVIVHSKVMIVDNLYAKVGSSNFTNRSMGLDTECDVTLYAGDNEQIQKEIEEFRWKLLSEFAGLSQLEIAKGFKAEGSLVKVLAQNKADNNLLKSFKRENPRELERTIEKMRFLDPEGPLEFERVMDGLIYPSRSVEDLQEAGPKKSLRKMVFSLGLFFSILVLIPLTWQILKSYTSLNVESLKVLLEEARQYPFTPLYILLLFSVGGTIFIPLNILIVATASIFPAWQAIIYILVGGLLCAMFGYGAGRLLGKHTLQKLFPKKVDSISQKLSQGGMLPIVLIRIIPVAPYAIINLLAGAGRIRLKNYFLGTLGGLLPGTLLLVFFQKSLLSLIFSPSLTTAIAFLIFLVCFLLMIIFLKRRFF